MERRLALLAATALISASSYAADPQSCSAPGVTVVTDPAGDTSVDTGQGVAAPVPDTAADILSLALSEPASSVGGNGLVFTYKMSDLSTVPPNHLWAVRFGTDVPPENGDDDYFVAMVSGPDSSVQFVYGTDVAVELPRVFTPAGALDPSSNYNADGTITLVLDKSKIPGLAAGEAVFGILPSTRVITPTDGTQPFTNGYNPTLLDQTDVSDDYVLAGSGDCSGKSGVLGLGAVPFSTLALLLGLAGLRRRA